VDWNFLAEDNDKCRVVMEMVTNFRLHMYRKFRVNVFGKTPGNLTSALVMKFIQY